MEYSSGKEIFSLNFGERDSNSNRYLLNIIPSTMQPAFYVAFFLPISNSHVRIGISVTWPIRGNEKKLVKRVSEFPLLVSEFIDPLYFWGE